MIAPVAHSLAELFSVYQSRRLIGCSPATLHGYSILLRHFHRFLDREPLITDLDTDTISDFLVARSPGRSVVTVDRERSRLLALGNFAWKRGALPEPPDVPPLRIVRRAPDSYSEQDFARLLTVVGTLRGAISGVPAADFWTAFFLTIYDTACRHAAAWSLQFRDFRPDVPSLLFRAEYSKTRNEEIKHISQQTAQAILRIAEPSRSEIFPWELHWTSRYNHIKRIFKAAGLPNGRRDLCQKLRRTSLTIVHLNGGDATEMAGHSSNAVTRRSYIDPSRGRQGVDFLPRPTLPSAEKQRFLF